MSMTRFLRTLNKPALIKSAQECNITRDAFNKKTFQTHRDTSILTFDEKHETFKLEKNSFKLTYFSLTHRLHTDPKKNSHHHNEQQHHHTPNYRKPA